MFTTIKDKLITNVSKINLLSPNSDIQNNIRNFPVDLSVGSEILSHFQQSWAELHEINECNAKRASIVAEQIKNMHEKVVKDGKSITKIINLLDTPPFINKCLDNCVLQLKTLYDTFENTEKNLTDLEVLINDLEFKTSKVDYLNSVISHRKKEMAENYAQSMLKEELKQKKIATERQQVFEEAFNTDLETYKTLGAIPKIQTKVQPSALLEEIQLDLDEKELETFLNEK